MTETDEDGFTTILTGKGGFGGGGGVARRVGSMTTYRGGGGGGPEDGDDDDDDDDDDSHNHQELWSVVFIVPNMVVSAQPALLILQPTTVQSSS